MLYGPQIHLINAVRDDQPGPERTFEVVPTDWFTAARVSAPVLVFPSQLQCIRIGQIAKVIDSIVGLPLHTLLHLTRFASPRLAFTDHHGREHVIPYGVLHGLRFPSPLKYALCNCRSQDKERCELDWFIRGWECKRCR